MENKAMQRVVALYAILKYRILNKEIINHFYKSLTRPILPYGAPTWGCAATSNVMKLHVIQNNIIRSVYDGNKYASNTSSLIALDVRTLNEEINRSSAKLYQSIRQHDNPIITALGNYDNHMH
jgi:hypothetical protein